MPNKLQELTDRLYNEGLSKGKEEGSQILEAARVKAEQTIAAANAEAASIVADAERRAAEIRSKAESDIRMASSQALQSTKKDIENLLLGSVCSGKVDAALADDAFLKELIRTVAERFSATQAVDMSLVLPESLKDKLEPWLASELKSVSGRNVSASFSKKVAGGFTIGPADGSWFVSLTDATFKELISEYLRPVTRKLLFGE